MTINENGSQSNRSMERWNDSTAERGAGRRCYPSDLTERQWRAIEPLLRDPSLRQTCPTAPLRDVANAVNYRWRSGCSWRMLPHDFPPWTTVYTHFRRWGRRGVLTAIRAALLSPRREATGGQGSTKGRPRGAIAGVSRCSNPGHAPKVDGAH